MHTPIDHRRSGDHGFAFPEFPLQRTVVMESYGVGDVVTVPPSSAWAAEPSDARLVASPGRVDIYARNEPALEAALAGVLRTRPARWSRGPLQVRVRPDPLRVPYMRVETRCLRRFGATMQRELRRRACEIDTAELDGSEVRLAGVAALQALLGLHDWASRQAGEDAKVTTTLAEWRVIGCDDPGPWAA